MGVGEGQDPPGFQCFGGETELVVNFEGETRKVKDMCHARLIVRDPSGIEQYAKASIYRTKLPEEGIGGVELVLESGQTLQVSPGHALYFAKAHMKDLLGLKEEVAFCRRPKECLGKDCKRCNSLNTVLPGFQSVQAKYLIGDKARVHKCQIKDYLYHVVLHDTSDDYPFRVDPKGHLLSEGLRMNLPFFGDKDYNLNCFSSR